MAPPPVCRPALPCPVPCDTGKWASEDTSYGYDFWYQPRHNVSQIIAFMAGPGQAVAVTSAGFPSFKSSTAQAVLPKVVFKTMSMHEQPERVCRILLAHVALVCPAATFVSHALGGLPSLQIMISSEFGEPNAFFKGFDPSLATSKYGNKLYVW